MTNSTVINGDSGKVYYGPSGRSPEAVEAVSQRTGMGPRRDSKPGN